MLLSCTQVTSLNLRRHEFGLQPTKIIWYQIAGLEEEHVAMLRFKKPSEFRTSFEQTTCMGKSWSYSFYDLRPAAELTFMSQMNGSKNVKLDCNDLQNPPIWKYLKESNYSIGILESFSNSSQTLEAYKSCNDGEALLDISYWKRGSFLEKNKTFHYADKIPFNKKNAIYDRTCTSSGCISSLKDNVISISKEFNKFGEKYLFIIRDFSYLKALQDKDLEKAKKILTDIESSFEDSIRQAENSSEYLVLLTTGESSFIEFPANGINWYYFENKNNKLETKRSKLTNLVLASGARSENFCGIYEDREIFERILSTPKQQGLEFKFINPFRL